MAAKAVIRMGDPTSHGGTVLEGHPDALLYGKNVAGVGHKVYCPKCKGSFPIVAGAHKHVMMGVNTAIEGMKASCGAVLIPTQNTFTIDDGETASSSGKTDAEDIDSDDSDDDDDEIIEQYFTLLDENDSPIDGYHYDLYKDGNLHTNAASFSGGKTVTINDDSNLHLVAWMKQDGATRNG